MSHYLRMLDRMDALLHEDGVDLSVQVPACPEWTAWEAACHAAAVVIDGAKGVVPDTIPPTPEWTARQVADHLDRPLDDVVADWRTCAEALGPRFLDSMEIPLLLDAVTHEHDVRAALGRQGAEDDPAVPALLDMVTGGLAARLGDLPPVVLDDGTTVRRTGDGEPGLVLRAGTFELLRALTSRRSQAQVRAMVADGDFDRYADRLALFAWPEADQPG